MYTAAKTDLNDKGATRDLKNGAHRVKADASDTLDSLKGDLQDMAQDIARKAGRHVRELADQANETLSETTDTITERITDKPMTYVAGALLAGFALGFLFRR